MYAEELTALIRLKTGYNGPSRNDLSVWRAAIDAACQVVNDTLEHVPPPKVYAEPPVLTKKTVTKKPTED